MNVSGPCFVMVKKGQPFNKYEVVLTETTPLTIKTKSYYFDKKSDAELYYKYLLQVVGEKEIKDFIAYNRNPQWEKNEYKEFRDSINWQELKDAVKDLVFIFEENEVRRMKK